VTVLRNALSSQPDHSVVIAETGYAKNLADLLASPGGAELVALKVKMLVEMGGSYLTGNHENNIAGDAGSAKTVSDSWPTKIVWSGSEVGDAVQSGGSIPTTHPATSPVRASYEAFATKFALPNTSINSWDLTAVYHAVRPNDTLLTETGPGANTIDATGDATYGNNTFVPNVAGKQYYLTLTSEAGLESALNVLLNQQPTASTTTTTAAPGSTTTTTQPTTTTTTQVNKPADVDPTTTNGYRLVDIFGTVYSFGVDDYGDLSDVDLNAPIVSATRTASGRGYWLLGADGGIFAFGDAKFYGSMGGQHLNQPVLGMAPTPTGNGYWLVAADGGIFSFGDAAFYGSMGGKHLNQPVVGITSSTSGHGYRMVATDGGIFAFGDAAFYGSMGGSHLNAPIVGMTPSATGNGYRMVATDGGIFAYGDAAFYGSMGGQSLNAPIVGMKATVSGNGYWFVSIDGGVFAFGDAPFVGSLVDEDLDTLIVALA
jgi:hypothetical protein